ncbi:MAG: hypothetical protein AB7H80_13255 [Candidatus Kapaibacterium sp.]
MQNSGEVVNAVATTGREPRASRGRFGEAQLWQNMFLTFLLSTLILSCAAPKEVVKEEEEVEDFWSMIPLVELSDDVVYSPAGDMRAHLPEGWISMNANQFGNPDIFAVACDPDYRMAVIFSNIPLDAEIGDVFRGGGMMGLLKKNYQDRVERINDWFQPQLIDAEEFALGRQRYGAYTFTTDSNLTVTRVGLFYTRKNLYECTMTHLPYSESELPTTEEMKEIHQIVLGGIEW